MLMMWLFIIPFLSAVILAFSGARVISNAVSIGTSLLTFICALMLVWQVSKQGSISFGNEWFYVDYLSAFLIIITTFLGLTTAIFSATYLLNEQLSRKLTRKNIRFYYSLYQFFFFAALLILVMNNLGILWVAMECATLCTILLIGLYHIPQSLEAAWKYLILCGLGLAQALLGTILLYFAAEKLLNAHNALLWTQLHMVSAHLSPHIVSLAFVFILVGYGTKAGFVPLHNWLPDAYGEGIAPVLSLLSGVLLNLAFYAILRFKFIVDGSVGSSFTNHFLLGFGLLNILVAACFLLRQREIKRLFAYSSIEHIGLISFAFGLGTPLAMFAGLLHMMAHSLSKTAAFFSTGQIIQIRNTLQIENIRGLAQDCPSLGWGLLLGSFALMGLPPSPLFTSEFLILFTTIKEHIWLIIPLVIGLTIAFAAILHQVQKMVFSKSEIVTDSKNIRISVAPIYLHLILIMGLGILIPSYLAGWLNKAIQLMSNFT